MLFLCQLGYTSEIGKGKNLAEPGIGILSSHVAQQKQDGYFNRLKYSQATTAFIIKHIVKIVYYLLTSVSECKHVTLIPTFPQGF